MKLISSNYHSLILPESSDIGPVPVRSSARSLSHKEEFEPLVSADLLCLEADSLSLFLFSCNVCSQSVPHLQQVLTRRGRGGMVMIFRCRRAI